LDAAFAFGALRQLRFKRRTGSPEDIMMSAQATSLTNGSQHSYQQISPNFSPRRTKSFSNTAMFHGFAQGDLSYRDLWAELRNRRGQPVNALDDDFDDDDDGNE
jgi:hypothetical protein